jgi:hypothetical protein
MARARPTAVVTRSSTAVAGSDGVAIPWRRCRATITTPVAAAARPAHLQHAALVEDPGEQRQHRGVRERGLNLPEQGRIRTRAPARRLWGLFFVCCLYSVDVMQNCEGSLSRDKFLF